jgi:hypothetical protein
MAVSNQKVNIAETDVYTCGVSVQIGEIVYINASGVLMRAKADSKTTMPGIGIVTEKPASTTCKIALFKRVSTVGGTNREKLFVSADNAGQITNTPPSAVGQVWQCVGFGLGTTERLIQIDSTNYVILS